MNNYVIGLDYDSDSVRVMLVNTNTGKEEASAPTGTLDVKRTNIVNHQKISFVSIL